MTDIDHLHARRMPHGPALAHPRRPKAQVVSDGVVAAYLHGLSSRHGSERRDGAPDAVFATSPVRSRRRLTRRPVADLGFEALADA
jgi:hypothetical protein